jgi:hypothetical protein
MGLDTKTQEQQKIHLGLYNNIEFNSYVAKCVVNQHLDSMKQC